MDANTPDDPDGRVAAVFAREVPEIASGKVVIRALARSPGLRTKVAVDSDDPDVDVMRACFDDRGRHLRNISGALGGEAVHVTTWSPYPDQMIRGALSPLRVSSIALDERSRRALVRIPQDQPVPNLARSADYLELASRLSGWDIEIVVDPMPPNAS